MRACQDHHRKEYLTASGCKSREVMAMKRWCSDQKRCLTTEGRFGRWESAFRPLWLSLLLSSTILASLIVSDPTSWSDISAGASTPSKSRSPQSVSASRSYRSTSGDFSNTGGSTIRFRQGVLSESENWKIRSAISPLTPAVGRTLLPEPRAANWSVDSIGLSGAAPQ